MQLISAGRFRNECCRPRNPIRRVGCTVATVVLSLLILLQGGCTSPAIRAQQAVALGHRYAASGNTDDALGMYTEAIELDESNADAYLGRGDLYDDVRRYDEAVKDYTQLLELEPGNTRGLFNRSVAYYHLGDFNRAIGDLSAILERDPTNLSALDARGRYRSEAGNLQEALTDFDVALAQQPNYVLARIHRGNALRKVGQYTLALQEYDKAVKMAPSVSEAWTQRGICRWFQRNYDGCVTDLTAGIRCLPSPPAFFYRARAFAAQGQVLMAIADLDQVIFEYIHLL